MDFLNGEPLQALSVQRMLWRLVIDHRRFSCYKAAHWLARIRRIVLSLVSTMPIILERKGYLCLLLLR